ncbi:uncharacterized protein ASPGLDRAFT_814718 [Aspergillus glaucus CBS 516.65]|uniref:Amino acid permease/ SLC12A domain-containing protein n=1 Tax=Aspergillus glaucus CBS 516.65 TaxID=1160497 RepID=A0A1L9VAR2_ASPGL|nr:hypothetical protein ASPGLDRAFT_814718 [Aspergillus glaucus CBS 516.65]OJJ81018.1 hypothetical protein ASPGLDRAFT_814718 [Aspergillus glaucus CBS 516.65]
MFFAAVFAAVFALVFVVAAATAVLDAGPLVLMSWLFKASWSVEWKKLRGSKIASQVCCILTLLKYVVLEYKKLADFSGSIR